LRRKVFHNWMRIVLHYHIAPPPELC
jgi:hypothetical protein